MGVGVARVWRSVLLLFAVVGCGATPGLGSSPVAKVAKKPEPPPIPDEEPCDPQGLDQVLSPLVIDWPATLRGDLETAMAGQVAVLAFSCDEVRVLSACKVSGAYDYRGISLKTDSTLISGKDNIRASFGGIAFGLSADLQRDAKLDLATVLVGKLGTTRTSLYRGELASECAGATHFVQRADVGAFAMSTGTSVQAGAAAEVWGQGLSAGAASKEARSKTDGDPKQCQQADAEAESAPERCRALIRVSLVPIREGNPDAAGALEARGSSGADSIGCPEGFVFSQGACRRRSDRVKTYLCREKDEVECRVQCELGDLPSCDRWAGIRGERFIDLDAIDLEELERVQPKLVEACAHDLPAACGVLAAIEVKRAAVDAAKLGRDPAPSDLEKLRPRFRRAFEYFEQACVAGERRACDATRKFYADEARARAMTGIEKSRERFVQLLRRGCSSASAVACSQLARELITGAWTKSDVAAALTHADKACTGGAAGACLTAGALLGEAKACSELLSTELAAGCGKASTDQSKASEYLERACQLGEKKGCRSES